MAVSLPLVVMTFSAGSSAERLKRVLIENRGRYTVNKDGFISLDLSNEQVQEAIEKQIHNLSGIKESK